MANSWNRRPAKISQNRLRNGFLYQQHQRQQKSPLPIRVEPKFNSGRSLWRSKLPQFYPVNFRRRQRLTDQDHKSSFRRLRQAHSRLKRGNVAQRIRNRGRPLRTWPGKAIEAPGLADTEKPQKCRTPYQAATNLPAQIIKSVSGSWANAAAASLQGAAIKIAGGLTLGRQKSNAIRQARQVLQATCINPMNKTRYKCAR